jgi:hypothetical protein
MAQLLPSGEAELVPTLSSLEPVYGGEGSQLDEARLRFARLGDRFQAAYGARPALFARSPGRCCLLLLLLLLLLLPVPGARGCVALQGLGVRVSARAFERWWLVCREG